MQQNRLALYPANSSFVEGYLTTPGQVAQAAHRLVEAAGFEVELEENGWEKQMGEKINP